MEPLDLPAVQSQLVRCQEILDAARQEGWTSDLVTAFDDATRNLHEGAVVRKTLHLSLTEKAVDRTEVPVNRLLTPEGCEENPIPEQSQVDLLSSIGELTLAEKLALQPLSNVAEGMSIIDRAHFTSVLFSGEEEVFSTLLDKLTRAATQEEALAMFQESLSPNGNEEEVETLRESFAKRIIRTFVS